MNMNLFDTSVDPFLLVRAATVYVTVLATAGACIWRRPDARTASCALLGFFWNAPVLLALNVVAEWAGWWRFEAAGGTLLGLPVDMWLSWAWLWGAVPAILFPRLNLAAGAALALAADLILMPAAAPALRLGERWLTGEVLAIAVALIPGQLLVRSTLRRERLHLRVALQIAAFAGMAVFILPAAAIEGSGGDWRDPRTLSAWQLSVFLQVLAGPAVIGLSAVQEFAGRGGGTPVPFDPPQRLVTSGIYAYVRNPMQLSGALLLAVLGILLSNLWISAAAVMAHLYSIGLAGWNEDRDLQARFGAAWISYRRNVRRWAPRFRPWHRTDQPQAVLYVSQSCGLCREVARWFENRNARHLTIVPAESHPTRALTRITYAPGDDAPEVSGIAAMARAWEHIHFGWMLLAAFIRLPGILAAVQLLVDAAGGGPRSIAKPEFPQGSCRLDG